MGQIQDLVERWWSLFEAGDLDAAAEFTHDDIEFRMPGAELRGRVAVREVLEAYRAAFPDLRHQFLDTVESGDTYAAELRITATHTGTMRTPDGDIPPTGKQVVWQSCDYIKVRDGKIASWHAYFDQVAFLTQLGLMPDAASQGA